MSNKYTRVIEKVGDYEEDIAVYEDWGYVAYEMPDKVVLMVHKNAPEDIKTSALKAQSGDHTAYLNAIRDSTAWEYKVETLENKPTSNKLKDIENACNKQGKSGWELTSVVYNPSLAEYILFFKKCVENW